MHTLALHEKTQTLAANLSQAIGRPVVVCSGQTSSGGTHYRLPGEDAKHYRWIPEITRYLSPFSTSKCSRREDHGKWGTPSFRSDFYFDLEPSKHLCLAFPLKEGERIQDFAKTVNDTTRLWCHYSETQIEASEESPEVVEHGLALFLQDMRIRRGKSIRIRGLRLMQTEAFQTPVDRQETWHLNTQIPNRTFEGEELPNTSFTIIRPPGYYSYDAVSLEEHSAYGICDRDPGACSVCHGKSGQRKHFGAIHVGAGSSLKGLICLDCFSDLADFLQGQK